MPLPFNKNLDLKLLDLVKDNPILYNTKHSKYLDFDSREVVWQKIGDALSRPASEFAGIQCQIQLGDFQEEKHKPGFIENLNEYLPETYSSSWGIEKKLLRAFRKHQGQSPLEAKNLYIKTARDLPTYGVTFFLVKEKQKDKKKLVPRLLGINAEAILRLDENTKEILQQWPLTHVKTYHVGKSETFTLNFGDYSDKEYSCKTQDAYRIRDILEGYIDIIRRRMLAKPSADPGDSMAICQDNIQSGQSHIIQHVSNQPSKLVKETFVGPSKIISYSQGSTAQQGTQIITMQQMIQNNQMKHPQNATKGEVAVRGDLSSDCVRKLKRMNSNSVKIVTLLTDPTEANVKDTQKLVSNMQDDLVVVEMGVKATAQQQTIEESRKMLLDEMQDLANYMNKLSSCTKSGHVDTSEAKDAAEKIADLTTEMYFSQDPKTKRRSELLNRSKNSIIAGEKLDDSIRRASFMAAASSATTGIDQAKRYLDEPYLHTLEDEEVRQLRADVQDRLGKLNAALALYLTAHSDPNNIDYAAAINSMNDISKLSPLLASDVQKVSSTEDAATREEIKRDMKNLFDGVKQLCALTGTEDHENMQEASSNYADVANKLIFTFTRGQNVNKENEIIDLAKDAGAKTSMLLITANELTHLAPTDPAVGEVDKAGVRCAGAARDLLACAQLTAPAIYEPHCQSALTAAAEGVSSSVHRLSNTWKPLVEDPTRQKLGEQLHQREMDVHKALERLKDAYANLRASDMGDESVPIQERQRLKFVRSLAGAKNGLQNLQYNWDKPMAAAGTKQPGQNLVQELKLKEAQRRLSPQLAQLNAAVAALAAATSDRNNPDYATAELALNTISELLPQIVKDMEVVSSKQYEPTRNAMQQHIAGICEATKEIFANVDHMDGLGDSATKFSAASSKLVFLISPGADKGKEKMVGELSAAAYDNASELLSHAYRLKDKVDGAAAAELDGAGTRAERAARALVTVAKVTAPSIDEARCSTALASAVEQLRGCTDEVTSACQPHLKPGSPEYKELQDSRKDLLNNLNKLLALCNVEPGAAETAVGSSTAGPQEKQRLKFINSISGAKKRLDAADQQMKDAINKSFDKKQGSGPNVVQELKQKEAQRRLSPHLAQLNAAIAALNAATAGNDNPDYAAAEKAINTISELMPQIVQDMEVVTAGQDEETRKQMQQGLMDLCQTAKEMVAEIEDPNADSLSIMKFGNASKTLVRLLNPKADQSKCKTVRAHFVGIEDSESELLSVANAVQQELKGDAAAELESKLKKASQDWDTLGTAAALLETNVGDPTCKPALASAAEQVRRSTKELVAACQPHMVTGSEDQRQMQKSHEYLRHCLNRMLGEWGIEPSEKDPITLRREQENEERRKRRHVFDNNMSDAKKRVDNAEQQLKEPLACMMMKEEDGIRARRELLSRRAQLHAATAALAAASAAADHGDYKETQRAVDSITDLMPQIVQSTCVVGGTMDEVGQRFTMQHARELCDAARALCDQAANPEGLKEAATKLTNASGKLVFLISPTVDHAKEIEITELSAAVHQCASDLLQRVDQEWDNFAFLPDALDSITKTEEAAEAFQTTAQVTAPTIASPDCSAALVSAAEKLRGTAKAMITECIPHVRPGQRPKELQNSQQQLENSLDKLVQACKNAQSAAPGMLSPEQREKQRLQFVNSLSGARTCFDDAQHLLKQPVSSSLPAQHNVSALQRNLADKLAQLNAAVATLAAATADREHPDYATAEQAVATIRSLMPQVVQDAKTLSATKEGPAQQAMLQQVQELCEASRAICDNAGQPQGVSEAAAKFSNATGSLMFTITPTADHSTEKQIIELSAASCVRASELLSQVQMLTQQVPGKLATDLDQRGANTADAAQALLAVAQVTASSMGSPQCQSTLESAVETLRGSAKELTSACSPHVKPGAQKQQLHDSHKELEQSLDALLQVCRTADTGAPGVPVRLTPEQREKQRLQFINSLPAAKRCFDDAQHILRQPVTSTLPAQHDASALQHQMADKLAQLNAAIAALAAATADREHPDYASAQRAVNTVTTLMPQLVKDAKALSATKDGSARQDMLQQVQQLCEASKTICENAGQSQALNEAAVKFSDASSKLMTTVSPTADPSKEKEIIDLSADSCVRASELLSQVQALTQQVPGDIATDLDQRGAATADAAQALLTVAQVTASSMGSPQCLSKLETAVETLRGSAAELTTACSPHVKPGAQQHQLQESRKELDKSLDALLLSCRAAQSGSGVAISPVEREQQRVRFIRSVSGASFHLDDAEKQLKEPLVCSLVKPSDSSAARHALRRRLAQLNASVAALAQATTDYKHPDYPMAERSIIAITELMPKVVQESKALSCTKDDKTQRLIQQNLNELYDASRNICSNANDPKKLNEAASKFAEKSSQLVALTCPGEDDISASYTQGVKGKGPGPLAAKPQRGGQKPAVPVRNTKTVAHPTMSRNSCTTQDFLDNLRSEESHDNAARIVAAEAKRKSKVDEDKKQFLFAVDTAENQIKAAKHSIREFYDAAQIHTPGIDAVEMAHKEQNMEDALARAGVHVAALVSANHADKLDYKDALEPIIALAKSVRTIVDDGTIISSTLQLPARQLFLTNLMELCDASKRICDATHGDINKLNDAAVAFGNQSSKLLKVVSADVNPALEKEVISRAKDIGDRASRLAQSVNTVASSAGTDDEERQRRVQDVCASGAQCVDAAGKLVYTAKLVAPSMHHASCQDALMSSADTLSSNMASFSEALKPLASDPQTKNLAEDARNLQNALEKLMADLKSGRLGKKRGLEGPINLDTPLKQMTIQIMDNAKHMAEHGELDAEQKNEYLNYSDRLAEALRALDIANARCQRAPRDINRRNELEVAIQDLQMTSLQMRPVKAGQPQNNIVDFRDFLQGLVTNTDELTKTADKNQAATGKRVADDIKLLCSKIREDASKLIDPMHHVGGDSFDDIMEIHEVGQECDLLVKELNSTIRSVPDQKARNALQAKLLPLAENCNLLRFAANCALSTAKSAAFDAALQDLENFESTTMKSLADQLKLKQKECVDIVDDGSLVSTSSEELKSRAQLSLLEATSRAASGEPQALRRALTCYSMTAVADSTDCCTDDIMESLIQVSEGVKELTEVSSRQFAVWQTPDPWDMRATGMIQTIKKARKPLEKKRKVELLKEEDTDRLLVCQRHKIEGTRSQLEDKFQQLSTKLSSMSGTIFQSVKKPESLSRSLHATADSAAQLANVARALKDDKRAVQSMKIEDASHEMCLATYSLLKTSEILCQNPNHHDNRRKLLDACHHLNDTINKLNRAIHPEPTVSRDCNEMLRNLQLQRSALLASPQPAAASPYAHCVEALQSQRDVLLKLNSDQAMSREEFLKSMLFITTAVGNSTECAAHATYLLSLLEKNKDAVLEGLVDVAKMQKGVAAIHDTCVRIVIDPTGQVIEEKKILEKQVEELLKDLDDGVQKTKDEDVKKKLRKCRKDVDFSSKTLYKAIDGNKPQDVIISLTMSLADDVRRVGTVLEHPELVPTVEEPSPTTQALCDEVVKNSTALVSNTQELIKEVKLSPEQAEMKWSSYNKRREVLAAFDALLKSIRSSGQEVSVLEADIDEAEQNKSYIQKQTDAAFKWLHKPMAKSDVRANGQGAVKNLIDVGKQMCEDLTGADKEDMRHLVEETEQLFTHCCKKYDQEQYSLLMERIRELKKAIERMAVTRVVEDFMDAEEPLADLEILADAERDEKTRKFLLERKIAELLAQLGRVSRTARFIADTGSGGPNVSTSLKTCSEQTELLAPMLVKAAEARIHKPDDKVVVDNYKNLLAKYTESLAKVRDLCDQSVDPMDFVQTAGETMQRMREDSTRDNDPMKCAYTSAAITKLANRVIHVGLSSSTARSDPELQRALTEAQQQLSAATPAPDTRASRMPDWKDTTAKILRATEEVESVLGGENIFKKQPDTNQPIYNEALNLHVAIRDWSSRDNEIVAVAKRMAVLMAKLSDYMNTDKQREVLTTSKSIVAESHEVARLAKKLAHECSDHRIKTNLLQVCERIPTISGQLKMLTTVKGSSLGHHGTQEDKEAMDMLVGNAQSLMISIQDVVKAAASASVKIMSQRGPRIKWVRKTYY